MSLTPISNNLVPAITNLTISEQNQETSASSSGNLAGRQISEKKDSSKLLSIQIPSSNEGNPKKRKEFENVSRMSSSHHDETSDGDDSPDVVIAARISLKRVKINAPQNNTPSDIDSMQAEDDSPLLPIEFIAPQTLDEIPESILGHITRMLQKPELRNFSLTRKNLAAVSSKHMCPELALEAVKSDWRKFKELSPDLKKLPEVWLTALRMNPALIDDEDVQNVIKGISDKKLINHIAGILTSAALFVLEKNSDATRSLDHLSYLLKKGTIPFEEFRSKVEELVSKFNYKDEIGSILEKEPQGLLAVHNNTQDFIRNQFETGFIHGIVGLSFIKQDYTSLQDSSRTYLARRGFVLEQIVNKINRDLQALSKDSALEMNAEYLIYNPLISQYGNRPQFNQHPFNDTLLALEAIKKEIVCSDKSSILDWLNDSRKSTNSHYLYAQLSQEMKEDPDVALLALSKTDSVWWMASLLPSILKQNRVFVDEAERYIKANENPTRRERALAILRDGYNSFDSVKIAERLSETDAEFGVIQQIMSKSPSQVLSYYSSLTDDLKTDWQGLTPALAIKRTNNVAILKEQIPATQLNDSTFLNTLSSIAPEKLSFFTDEIKNSMNANPDYTSLPFMSLPDSLKTNLDFIKNLSDGDPRKVLLMVNLNLFEGDAKQEIIDYLRKGSVSQERPLRWPSDQ